MAKNKKTHTYTHHTTLSLSLRLTAEEKATLEARRRRHPVPHTIRDRAHSGSHIKTQRGYVPRTQNPAELHTEYSTRNAKSKQRKENASGAYSAGKRRVTCQTTTSTDFDGWLMSTPHRQPTDWSALPNRNGSVVLPGKKTTTTSYGRGERPQPARLVLESLHTRQPQHPKPHILIVFITGSPETSEDDLTRPSLPLESFPDARPALDSATNYQRHTISRLLKRTSHLTGVTNPSVLLGVHESTL